MTILDPDEKILPDLSAKVNFTSESTRGREARTSVEVTRNALVTREGQLGVWVLKGDSVIFRGVRKGAETETGVEIAEGLSGGESLAVPAPGATLQDGMKVKVKE